MTKYNKVVVQEFVAEWYEKHKDDLDMALHILASGGMANDYPNMDDWYFQTTDAFEKIIKMKLFGYEVKKEKRYYLKNKLTTSYLALESDTGYYCHVSSNKPYKYWRTSFTQAEIDSMETGSYEQIEAEE